ncbi:hypothetical protein [Metabacillus sp. FJAT-52054]|uniref:MFS transporter n=1 Tax=Metabacillus sediminis TaxID=3117746 RepID=A0ABZ2NDE4_9BACI
MDFISWNFILYLLAGLLIWVPVFLLIPFPLRAEGKWLITAVSFLLALMYLAGSQVMPIWQSVLVTALLLGMAAYFIHQKGAKFLAAEGYDHTDEDLYEESPFEREESNQYPEYEQFHNQNDDVKTNEDEIIDLDWFEEKPDDQERSLVEDENEEILETDWYIEETASSEEEFADKTETSVPFDSDPELLEEWFESHPDEEESGVTVDEEDLDSLNGRSFLEELSENNFDQEKEESLYDNLDTGEGTSLNSISEKDAVLIKEIAPVSAADVLMELAGEPEIDFTEEETEKREAEITDEEMKGFASWFEEDAVKDDLPVYDLDLDVLQPITNDAISDEEELSVGKAAEAESVMAFDSDSKSAEEEFEQEEAVEEKAAELQIPELYVQDIEENTDTGDSGDAYEEREVEQPLEEAVSIQKSMPDEFLEVLYNQLLELKETSLGYEFNAIMDKVLTSTIGIREYFVFVQLYLTYLEEKGQEIEFQNVYMEAMEYLESYPYLKEQLSWTKKQQQ